MIRCVVFDFDGTLVESNGIKRQTFFELAEEFEGGARLMKAILARKDAGDRYSVFEQFAAALPVSADGTKLADRYTQICQQRIAAAPEIAGTARALEQLGEEGKLLYVNSATPVGPLVELLCLRNMKHRFRGVYGAPKGKYENLQAITAECAVNADEVLMVGDSESDRAAAEMMNCYFVGVRNKDNDFSQSPGFLIDDLRQLSACVSKIDRLLPEN